jgi:hypothetical protein
VNSDYFLNQLIFVLRHTVDRLQVQRVKRPIFYYTVHKSTAEWLKCLSFHQTDMRNKVRFKCDSVFVLSGSELFVVEF